jgi:hypothetical protein
MHIGIYRCICMNINHIYIHIYRSADELEAEVRKALVRIKGPV